MANTRTLQVRNVRFDMAVPPGTAKAVPLLTAWNLGKVVVDQISVRVPPGHSGLTGLAVHYAGVPIVPTDQPGVFFVGDDQEWVWTIGWEISGPFTLVTYNTDIYTHTFYLAAQVRDISLVVAGATEAGGTIVTTVGPSAGPSVEELADAVTQPPAEEPPAETPPATPAPGTQPGQVQVPQPGVVGRVPRVVYKRVVL